MNKQMWLFVEGIFKVWSTLPEDVLGDERELKVAKT